MNFKRLPNIHLRDSPEFFFLVFYLFVCLDWSRTGISCGRNNGVHLQRGQQLGTPKGKKVVVSRFTGRSDERGFQTKE